MDNTIKQLCAICTTNTYKIHDLIDRILRLQSKHFNGTEIEYKRDLSAFVTLYGHYELIVLWDLNSFKAVVRVCERDKILAECMISIKGEYYERYSRMDSGIKNAVSEWFTDIGQIDISTLQMSEPDEAESEISEEAQQ